MANELPDQTNFSRIQGARAELSPDSPEELELLVDSRLSLEESELQRNSRLRQEGWTTLSAITAPESLNLAEGYIVTEELSAAVEVAIQLNQPLLLTGEPGTGKSTLADTLAARRGGDKPLKFIARSTTTSQDLFYIYDGLQRFLDAHGGSLNQKKLEDREEYITYQALGLAILLALPPQMRPKHMGERWQNARPRQSVVLIDEIDKAPRDFPNDILNEVEKMKFQVKETDLRFPDFEGYEARMIEEGVSPTLAKAEVEKYREIFEANRPIIILTSNEEKELPAAFLRRCLFYHIPFPEPNTEEGRKILRAIVETRLGPLGDGWDQGSLDAAITIFEAVRKEVVEKTPATAELIAWVRMLKVFGINPTKITGRNKDQAMITKLLLTVTILAKSPADRRALTAKFKSYADNSGK